MVDQRIICAYRIPRKNKSRTVHKKYTTNTNFDHYDCEQEENKYIECSLLGKEGVVIYNYPKSLFQRACLKIFINEGYNNRIVDNLSLT